ncbi:hypothetical protein ACQP2U_43500 (plasmid) [Nocardia sp. CA-084685]|uniref:hypothetical protein n=1 Tax=Nocardia sp. CA-084685 TaxID=3239970 RepID=UPI003D99A03E
MAQQWEDPAPHIGSDFIEAFPTWPHFHRFIDDHAAPPEVGSDRILHQVLAADFAQRLAAVEPHDWVLLGSLSLPARPVDTKWPTVTISSPLDPAYIVARAAFDLDLSARDLDDRDPEQAATLFSTTVARLLDHVAADDPDVLTTRGLGLGGLVRYSIAHRTVHPNGTTMGVVVAQPRDTHLGPHMTVPVDDPINIEFDIKPPVKVGFEGPSEPSLRPVVAITFPGMKPYTPDLLPTAHQLATKICMLSGPPSTSRIIGAGPWHRYKDLFDCYYLIRNCRFDAQGMREAIRTNQNLARFGRTDLPDPYRLYPGDPGSDPIPWLQGVELLRSTHPELRDYPAFPELEATITEFVAALRSCGPTAVWESHRWLAKEAAPTGIDSLEASDELLDALGAAADPHTDHDKSANPRAKLAVGENPSAPSSGLDGPSESGSTLGM